MSPSHATFDLPERPTQDDCEALFEFLDENLPVQDIIITAKNTKRVGALTMQVLVSGCKYAHENQRTFAIEEPSEGFLKSCSLLGLPLDYFEEGAAS